MPELLSTGTGELWKVLSRDRGMFIDLSFYQTCWLPLRLSCGRIAGSRQGKAGPVVANRRHLNRDLHRIPPGIERQVDPDQK